MQAELPPWNAAAWRRLARALERLPHALLLYGPAGLGKADFALRLAALRLCDEPPGDAACGRCRACRLLAAGTHPDFHVLMPEQTALAEEGLLATFAQRYGADDPPGKDRKPRAVIAVDQVRRLGEAVATRSHSSAYRVVVLQPAEAMNTNAANALLKLLEEPPPQTLMLLVAATLAPLPATVRSRCVRIDFTAPPAREALAWLADAGVAGSDGPLLLALAGGAPLTALAWARQGFLAQREGLIDDARQLLSGGADPLAVAGRWREGGAGRALHWLHGALADMIRLRHCGEPPRLANPDCGERLRSATDGIHLNKLYRAYDAVGRRRAELGGPLDEALLLEDVLIGLQALSDGQ